MWQPLGVPVPPNPSPSLICSLSGQGGSPGSLATPLPLPGRQEHRGRSAESRYPSLPSSHPPGLGLGSTKGIADLPRSPRAGQRKGASRLGAGPQCFPKTGQRSELGSRGRNPRKGPLLTWSTGQSPSPPGNQVTPHLMGSNLRPWGKVTLLLGPLGPSALPRGSWGKKSVPWGSGVAVSERFRQRRPASSHQGAGGNQPRPGGAELFPTQEVLIHAESRAPPGPTESGSACRQASH